MQQVVYVGQMGQAPGPVLAGPTPYMLQQQQIQATTLQAERVASLLPDAVLLSLPSMAHSALDFREPVALASADAVGRGDLDGLAARASALDALPPRPEVRLLWKLIGTAAAAEGALPIPARLLRRISSA